MSSALLHFSHFFGENVCIWCYQCVFLSLVYSIARFFISFNLSFKNMRASSALLQKKQSSTYQYRQDGGGSKQNRVRTANSQLKNEHGHSFFSVPAGVFSCVLNLRRLFAKVLILYNRKDTKNAKEFLMMF